MSRKNFVHQTVISPQGSTKNCTWFHKSPQIKTHTYIQAHIEVLRNCQIYSPTTSSGREYDSIFRNWCYLLKYGYLIVQKFTAITKCIQNRVRYILASHLPQIVKRHIQIVWERTTIFIFSMVRIILVSDNCQPFEKIR